VWFNAEKINSDIYKGWRLRKAHCPLSDLRFSPWEKTRYRFANAIAASKMALNNTL
jgi:hypothetical protein